MAPRWGAKLFVFLYALLLPRSAARVKAVSAKDVIWELSQGNSQFVANKDDPDSKFHLGTHVDKLLVDPSNPMDLKVIVISDARAFASIDKAFNTDPGEVQVVRSAGFVCGAGDPFDGVIGSVEFAFNQSAAPLVMVLGNSLNFVVESAVRLALLNSTRKIEVPPAPKLHGTRTGQRRREEEMDIIQEVLPSARDAVLQDPHASFEELCDIAAKLNVWNTVETLMSTSVAVFDAVQSGQLQVHGAFMQVQTGKVFFMGEHPAKKDLMKHRPAEDLVRTAEGHSAPAEEAYAVLYAGNKRYSTGVGGNFGYSQVRHTQLSTSGQNPIAVVLGCADSRAPPETFFDARPGELFVLRTAGNTCANGQSSILGSAEYAIANLHTKLVVVMGHTKCGAVTAAVSTVRANQSMTSLPGSIGKVLASMKKEAAQAVAEAPEGSIVDLVNRATELNVFATIQKLLRHSKIIRDGVRMMDLQIHGAVYDVGTGAVQWLGQHPNLEQIVRRPLPVHVWKVNPYIRQASEWRQGKAAAHITKLQEGNKRFTSDNPTKDLKDNTPSVVHDRIPEAIIVGGTEIRVPIEVIFDAAPGELFVQRSMGSIAGHAAGTLFDSLEYSVLRFAPKLLVVLTETDSQVIGAALDHVNGKATSFGPTHIVLDRVAVSAVQAVQQADDDSLFTSATRARTSAGRDMKVRRLTVELNALYTVEQLLRHSKIIRQAVRDGAIEIHAAILHEGTGEVEFIGVHPQQKDLITDIVISPDEDVQEKPSDACIELDVDHDEHEGDDHSNCKHEH